MGAVARLELLHEDATLRIAGHRSVMLAGWWDAPTGAQMAVLRRCSEQFQDRHPEGAGFWDAIVSGTPAFTAEVREEAAALSARDDLFACGTAHVILIEGFRGTATRMFLSTVTLLGRPKNPARVFGEAAPAAEWLADGLAPVDPTLDQGCLLELHAELCDRPR